MTTREDCAGKITPYNIITIVKYGEQPKSPPLEI